ncbi:hypothetical protein ACROYT_G030983 [Oculina patagonica]
MHPGKLKENPGEEEDPFAENKKPAGVALSLNGKYVYVMEVFVREGVLILEGDHKESKLQLWDFELSKCVRTFSEVDSKQMLFPVSDDHIGCVGDRLENGCRKVNILSVASAEIVFTTSVQGHTITSIACSDKFQFVVCHEEEVRSRYFLNIVEVAVWNNDQHFWKRSVVLHRQSSIQPQARIARNKDLVVTWRSLDQGAGVHVLNASTGAAIHKLLAGQKYVFDCKFLSDENHFVCCSSDEVVRLYNVNSGELISLVDIESHPFYLAVCFDEPLFAVALGNMEYGLFRVHLPEVQVRRRDNLDVTEKEQATGISLKRRGESPSYSSPKRSTLTPDHPAVIKEGTPEKVDLERLAQKIPDHWKKLGRRLLENDEEALNAIHKENEEYSEKAYKMLLKWKQAKGAGATFRVLHDALCHDLVNRQDLAEKFCLYDNNSQVQLL